MSLSIQELKQKPYSNSLDSISIQPKKEIKRRKYTMPNLSIENEHDYIADDEITSILKNQNTSIEYVTVGEEETIIVVPYEEEEQENNPKQRFAFGTKYFSLNNN